MNIVCLDMEGVLVPEIWIAFAEESGIPELKRTTRDEPDYDKLMEQAAVTTDDAKQTDLYKQAAKLLSDTAANVYIQDLADFVVLKNGLEGYQFYPLYVMDLSTVHYVQ